MNPKTRTAEEWQADLEQSERELAAGLTVSGESVFQRLQESIERLEKMQSRSQRR